MMKNKYVFLYELARPCDPKQNHTSWNDQTSEQGTQHRENQIWPIDPKHNIRLVKV